MTPIVIRVKSTLSTHCSFKPTESVKKQRANYRALLGIAFIYELIPVLASTLKALPGGWRDLRITDNTIKHIENWVF